MGQQVAELVFPREAFDPTTIFTSGQTFRFRKDEAGVWSGVAHGTRVHVRQEGSNVVFTAQDGSLDLWKQYTDADRRYGGTLFPDADDVLRAALDYGRGLRVLRQEPFETLISFIISANNNIPRITGIIDRLCRTCAGESCGADVPFPQADDVLGMTEADLREIGAGYRAKYILESARRAKDTDFAELAAAPYEEAHAELTKFSGVGPKVADCIALFGLGKAEAFPVDVWVKRILRTLYGVTGTPRQLREFAAQRFGKNAGIAQQYLFHYARAHLEQGS